MLVVEDAGAEVLRGAAESALAGLTGIRDRVDVVSARTAAGAARTLAGPGLVCVAVDASLPAAESAAILDAVSNRSSSTPVLLFDSGTNGGTGPRLHEAYRRRCRLEIVHSAAQAVERLTLHLLTDAPRPAADGSTETEAELPRFDGEKVLVIDDDIRNVFALTSALELQGLTVMHAGTGREGIELLTQHEDIALVLMDIMMPGMDGYATTGRIRRLERFKDLPIIAVTARAMTGDREKSLVAGTNEHVTKPVDVGGLLGLIRTMIVH